MENQKNALKIKKLLRMILGCCFLITAVYVFFIQEKSSSTRICLIKFATHPALDETEQGVLESLRKAIATGDIPPNTKIDLFNASGQPSEAKRLAEVCSNAGTALIVTIATPAAQAVARTESDIPLIYGAVSDPEGAGLFATNRATGIKNVGPSIVSDALKFIMSAFPGTTRIGTIYNPAEQNSVYVQRLIKEECDKINLTLIARSVSDTAELGATAEVLMGEVDVLYSANDNTVNAGARLVSEICIAKKKPFIIGDLSTLSKGPAAAIGLDYFKVGKEVGEMAAAVIKKGDVSLVPHKGPPNAEVKISEETLKKIGIVLDREFLNSISIGTGNGN